MILVGMTDSPYVRRVAVSLALMRIRYTHEHVSVFRHYDRFKAINPVVKAPTLITDEGLVLMDSTLILDHIESMVEPHARLMPQEIEARGQALRVIGLAMAGAEKCVQLIYEQQQRPADKRHPAWIGRVTGQANAALTELEAAAPASGWFNGARIGAADVATACLWRFGQYYRNETTIEASRYPRLAAHSARAEALEEFHAVPLD